MRPASSEVTGIVLDVQSRSLTDVTAFTLRTSAGEVLSFDVGPLDLSGGAFPASHLREHVAGGEPVRVVYRMEAERRVATQLFDASEP